MFFDRSAALVEAMVSSGALPVCWHKCEVTTGTEMWDDVDAYYDNPPMYQWYAVYVVTVPDTAVGDPVASPRADPSSPLVDEDPVIFADVYPPVRLSDLNWMQTGVQKPNPGLVTASGRRGPRSAERAQRDSRGRSGKWERARERQAIRRAVEELETAAMKERGGRSSCGRRRRAKVPRRDMAAGVQSTWDLRALCPYTFGGTSHQQATLASHSEMSGKVVVDPDDPGVKQDSRFCRRSVSMRRKYFKLSEEAQKILDASRVWRRPVLRFRQRRTHNVTSSAGFDVGRRERNRLAHALNGNGMMMPADELADVAGANAVPGCYLFGMCDVSRPTGVFSELVRSAIEQSEGGDVIGETVVVRPADMTAHLRVVVKPRALSAVALPVMAFDFPIVAVVNLAAPRDHVNRALDELTQLSDEGWLVLVLITDVVATGMSRQAAVDLLARLCRRGIHGAMCDDRAPSWEVIYHGVIGRIGNAAVPPWTDEARLARRALMPGMVSRPLDPESDAPASWNAVRGLPVDFVEDVDPPANVVLTDSATLWDIELRGIEGVRGIWAASDANLRDLLFAIARRYGVPVRWRFHAHGLPLHAESPLGELRGAIIRATVRAPAGARGDARAVMDVGATDGGTSAAASSSTARPADFLDRVDESGAPPASPPPDLLHTYASQLGIFSQESKRRRMGDVDDVGETAATESRAALPTGTSLALGVGAGGVAGQARWTRTSGRARLNMTELITGMRNTVARRAQPKTQVVEDKYSIVVQKAKLIAQVEEAHPEWHPMLKHLVVGLLALHKLRLQDVAWREEVLIVHVIEGDRYLRAHAGYAYLYHLRGDWALHSGYMSQGALIRTREYLLRLEGLLRTMDQRTPCHGLQLMQEVRTIITTGADKTIEDRVEEWELRASRSSLKAIRAPRAAASHQAGAGDDEGGDAEVDVHVDDGLPFTRRLATIIAKVSCSLQRRMLLPKLLEYYCDWCNTPMAAEPGAAFRDTCMLFDRDGQPVTYVEKGPERNVYLFVDQCLLDPVAQDARETLDKFLSQTFWNNELALQCQLAGVALALRGMNVDRCMWGIGRGGVGQSLFSALLSNVFGGLHAYLDTGIYYSDDELRKQAEALLGRIIVTGQEAVEGSQRAFRQDIYKRHVAGDVVASRLPYAIHTRMVPLLGLKRLELNRLVRFTGVTEGSFDSILRRSWVMIFRAQFKDATELAEKFPQGPPPGVFPRNPSLKAWVRSPPAARAMLELIQGFLEDTPKDLAEDLIELYAARGGDDYITLRCMRYACGLDVGADPSQEELVSMAAPSAAAPVEERAVAADTVEGAQRMAEQLMVFMLSDNKEHWVPSASTRCTQVEWLGRLNQKARHDAFEKMADLAGWHRSRGSARRRLPMVHTLRRLSDVVPLTVEDADEVFTELYDLQALEQYANGTTAREDNHKVLVNFLTAAGRRTHGVPSRRELEVLSHLNRMRNKLEDQETAMLSLLKMLREIKDDPERQVSYDGRVLILLRKTYRRKLEIRSRRYVDGVGAQSLSRTLLGLVCPHTQDWDISRCAFALVAPLVDRLEVRTRLPHLSLACVKEIGSDRDAVCRALGMPSHVGKQILTRALHGGDLPDDDSVAADGFLAKLRMEARALRWLAVSLLPQQYQSFCNDAARAWPEATTFHYMWTAAEDFCLTAWIEYVRSLHAKHISLHFDGLRVDELAVPDADAFVRESVAAIERNTGFRVQIHRKIHLTLLEGIQKRAYRREPVEELHEVVLRPGNCIPAALAQLCPELRGDIVARLQADDAANRSAMAKRARTYREWHAFRGLSLEPSYGMQLTESDHFLVHTDGKGSPHCFSVRRLGEFWCVVDGSVRYFIEDAGLREAFSESTDHKNVVSFDVKLGAEAVASPMQCRAQATAKGHVAGDAATTAGRDGAPRSRGRGARGRGSGGGHRGGRRGAGRGSTVGPPVEASAAVALPSGSASAVEEAPEPMDVAVPNATDILLDLAAGAAGGAPMETDVCPPSGSAAMDAEQVWAALGGTLDATEVDDDMPDMSVNLRDFDPGLDLLSAFLSEVDSWKVSLKNQRGGHRPMKSPRGCDSLTASTAALRTGKGSFRCPLCPFREFQNPARVLAHLRQYHVAANRFLASGTKQLRVAIHLFETEQLDGVALKGKYLERSATELRKTIRPPLSVTRNDIDRYIRLVVTDKSASFMNALTINKDFYLETGGYRVSSEFCSAFMKHCVMQCARVRGAASHMLFHLVAQGFSGAGLLPQPRSAWWSELLAVLMTSTGMRRQHRLLMTECEDHGEFASLSVDGTMKITMKVLGQAPFNRVGGTALEDPERAGLYRVVTVRGITAGVVAIEATFDESADSVVRLLTNVLTDSQLRQVQHVAVDNASPLLWHRLRDCMPSLRLLSLDPTHLAMQYEACTGGVRTVGSCYLRVGMNRFTRVAAGLQEDSWGPAFDGRAIVNTPMEEVYLNHIRRGDLSDTQSRKMLTACLSDAEQPWLTRLDFIKFLAAVSSCFPEEMRRKTAAGSTLRASFAYAAAPTRCEWYFNTQRFHHSLSRASLEKFPSGTASNESLHAELNRWFRPVTGIHRQTLRIRLRIFQLAKMLAHNRALYRPTTAQWDQQTVLARSIASFRGWSDAEWRALVRTLDPLGSHRALMCDDRARLRTWSPPRAPRVLKRPARAALPIPQRTTRNDRRPVFRLRRKTRILK